MKRKDTTQSSASDWSAPPVGRMTPADIQQKEFRIARLGAGYRMREVDEFLDQVTDALSALIAENERLVRGSGDQGSASGREPVRPATRDTNRAAVEAFLQREKGFLQDLGGLVQEHAEELRSMVRAARRSTPADATAVAPEDVAEVRDDLGGSEQATTAMVAGADDASQEGLEDESDDGSAEEPGEPEEREEPQAAVTITQTAADEPIRLDEPEPARSGRQDEKEDSSLRELFWGEE